VNDCLLVARELLVTMPHLATAWSLGITRQWHGQSHDPLAEEQGVKVEDEEEAEEVEQEEDGPSSNAAPPFMLTLFSLIFYSDTFDNAVCLMEEILADRPAACSFPLSSVRDLDALVASLPAQQAPV
jgi:hypothetical protein